MSPTQPVCRMLHAACCLLPVAGLVACCVDICILRAVFGLDKICGCSNVALRLQSVHTREHPLVCVCVWHKCYLLQAACNTQTDNRTEHRSDLL